MTLRSDHKWMVTHSKEIEKFEGEFVAILNKKIVASGMSYEDVWNTVKSKYPGKFPIITYIFKADEMEHAFSVLFNDKDKSVTLERF